MHNDAVVCEAFHEVVRDSVCHFTPVVVVSLVADIEHGFQDVAHAMSKQVYGHHGNGVSLFFAFVADVFLVVVLCAKILSEPQGLGFEPCLLQFDQHEVSAPVGLPHGSAKVNAEHGDLVACAVWIFVAAHIHGHHILLQQCGNQDACHALVLHEELEHGVVNRVGNGDGHSGESFPWLTRQK